MRIRALESIQNQSRKKPLESKDHQQRRLDCVLLRCSELAHLRRTDDGTFRFLQSDPKTFVLIDN